MRAPLQNDTPSSAPCERGTPRVWPGVTTGAFALLPRPPRVRVGRRESHRAAPPAPASSRWKPG